MNKQKSRSSVAKRFSRTGSGKIRYKKQGVRHLLIKKRGDRKRRLRGIATLSPSDSSRISAMLGKK